MQNLKAADGQGNLSQKAIYARSVLHFSCSQEREDRKERDSKLQIESVDMIVEFSGV